MEAGAWPKTRPHLWAHGKLPSASWVGFDSAWWLRRLRLGAEGQAGRVVFPKSSSSRGICRARLVTSSAAAALRRAASARLADLRRGRVEASSAQHVVAVALDEGTWSSPGWGVSIESSVSAPTRCSSLASSPEGPEEAARGGSGAAGAACLQKSLPELNDIKYFCA